MLKRLALAGVLQGGNYEKNNRRYQTNTSIRYNVYRCTTCNDYTLGSLWVLEYSIVRGTEYICPFIVWNNTHSVWIITQTRIKD